MSKTFTKYLEYFKIGFKQSIEYKSYLLTVTILPLISVFFLSIVWKYIFALQGAEDPNFVLGGFTYVEMITYLLITSIIATLQSTEVADSIADQIKTGNIAIVLCRPVRFVLSQIIQILGTNFIYTLSLAVLVIAFSFIFNLPRPGLLYFSIFLVYLLMYLIFFIFTYIIVGGLSFWLTEIWGIQYSFDLVFWILAGRIIPISLFPTWAISILKFTPFYYLDFMIAQIYLQKITILEVGKTIGIFTVWIILLGVLVWFVFKKGFQKLESLGG